ncbi:MAG: SIS domain-containing protein [Candidatus Gastranaerophilales bacterium]|nr:SIS domain-containing protein [Candidatus Gastranaerophilales bacterium]
MEKLLEKRASNFLLLKNQKENIEKFANMIKEAFLNNNKILFCGNGGSASDSNHLACEFVSKFQKERKALNAISLCTNNSIITAISNDYSFDDVFSRQIEATGKKGDILIAISTSGKSKNILKAINQAKKQGLKTIFLTGEIKTNNDVELEINVPSIITCEIQEMHIALGHIVCEMVENSIV